MKCRNYLVIALMSITLIALELSWTRIFSAEFFYTFAFLVLSLAILGLGFGALALRLLPLLNRESMLGVYLSLTGLMAIIGPILVFKIGLDFSQLFSNWGMIGKFLVTVILLSSAFFWGGIGLAMLFKRNHEDMPRLYMADLVGAGVGVVAIIWLMNTFGTPAATFLIAFPILIAALLTSKGAMKAVPIVLALAVVWLCPKAPGLLEVEGQDRAPVIYKHWDAMAKIKVYDFNGYYRGIEIDNTANSPIPPFDGDFNYDDTTSNDWSINVANLIDRFDSCVFLSLGAGGGMDVLQGLAEQAAEVHAVEVNPHINHMMQHGDPDGYIDFDPPAEDTTVQEEPEVDSAGQAVAQQPPPYVPNFRDSTGAIITSDKYSGNIYNDPRVIVVSEDARTYVKRFENKFDVIYSLSSNTWAALASGSFALAENYLFTTEAFIDYWNCLSDSGFLSMEHQVYMPRLVSELTDALEILGVEEPTDHFAIYDMPNARRKLLLVSKQPLTEEIVASAYGPLEAGGAYSKYLLYPAADSLKDNLINRIVQNGWEGIEDAPVDLSPCTDDRPFVAQLGLWKNLSWERFDKVGKFADFGGFPLSKVIILIILGVVILIVLPINLIPYFLKGDKLKAVPWLYFFTIGMAFMMVEVVLIQKYALFIGASIYCMATVLLTLLVASGIGSRFSQSFSHRTAFFGIVGWILLDALVFPFVTGGLSGLTLVPRIMATALLLFPLGFFMGMPFPKGTRRVGELIDWGFAVNGAASVLGATLVVLVAFSYGFAAALILGAVLYLVAYMLMSAKSSW